MDKNLIHIDDLIRQRLNGEEKERAGAWLRMKDLLDSSMPTKAVPVAAWNWKKTALSVAAIAGIFALGFGGYEMSSAFRGSSSGGGSTSENVPASLSSDMNSNSTEPASSASEAQGESATAATVADNSSAPTLSTSDATNNSGSTPAVAKTTVTKPANLPTVNKPTTRSNNRNSNTTNTVTHSSTTKNSVQQPLDNTTSSASNTTSPSPKNNASHGTASNNPVAGNNTPANQRVADNMPVMRTVPSTMVVNRPVVDAKGNVRIHTTVTSGPQIPVKNEPVFASSHSSNSTTSALPALPQASFIGPMPDESDNSRTIVPASASTGGGTHSAKGGNRGKGVGMFGWVNQLVESLSQYQWGKVGVNTGVVAGGNLSIGKYGLYGMQGGFFADFIFHEKWSLRAEARYSHRFNKITNVYSDNYISYTPTGGTFNKETNEHYFKYSTVTGFDVPLMLQYNVNNFYVFGGANFAYFQAIKTEEIERTTTIASVPNVEKTRIPLTVNDFNSRFGGGYLLGIGYTVNMVSFDARMVHNVWDNAKTPGAQQISRDIYYKPNFQFNISYRFGKDKRSNELVPGGN